MSWTSRSEPPAVTALRAASVAKVRRPEFIRRLYKSKNQAATALAVRGAPGLARPRPEQMIPIRGPFARFAEVNLVLSGEIYTRENI
jgi:hypothetical protein